MSAIKTFLVSSLVISAGLCAPAPQDHHLASRAIVAPAGFTKVLFQEDFSTAKAGGQPDKAKWTYDLGKNYPGGAANWGTGEIQTYTDAKENIAFVDGALRITPVRKGEAWTSARIETTKSQDFTCAPGKKLRIEAEIKLSSADPATQMGIWPAFWSMGSAFRDNVTSWPAIGEIDVLEVANGQAQVFHTAHCGVVNGGPCDEKNGKGGGAAFPRGRFVKMAVDVDRTASDWKAEKLVWSVDGKTTLTITGQQIGDQKAWAPLTSTPKMILINVAVGGEFPFAKGGNKPTPDAKTVGGAPSAMDIKYVAVYTN
ncbi:secreted glucosidase [Gaeumannomyces tritici R3-111a-1]|uniref:Secreted glucosidase n=1 Tax=Gaeumannomyces tritici (strain R3-111a-1) TaxID=644352 RepID=J3PFV8_GAET3|nr:secreted glucosidase [Gaeumannomyces tritici R3-111a-1]EJT70210.1 secreted glucosidase [Gaeumannomyces tritici R3-111a-1]